MNCTNCRHDVADGANFCAFCGARQYVTPGVPAQPHKKLMRSTTDRRIAGICGGIAEYFEIDSTIVRLMAVVLALMPMPVVPGVVAYLIAWIIIPKAPAVPSVTTTAQPHSTPA